MISSLTFLIVVLGSLTVVFSCFIAWRFRKQRQRVGGDSRRLTNALMWQLVGEAIIGAGTLAFAIAAAFDVLSGWPIWFQSMIRLVMFFATTATTLHLWRTILRIKK